jgi:small ligand-binding sensory domain FIST
MQAGIGYCTEKSSYDAGTLATRNALEKGKEVRPDLLIAFCSGKINPDEFYRGIRDTVGPNPAIIGGTSIGIITNDHISYDGYSSAVAALQLDGIPYQVAEMHDLDKDGEKAGEELVSRLSDPSQGNAFLIFYDSVKNPATNEAPPVLNPSSTLIKGIENRLGTDIPIFGAGLLSDFEFRSGTKQFCGFHAAENSVVGLLLNQELKPYFRIMHGCNPLDGVYHRITRIQGDIIYEIDNRPAVEMIDSIYQNQEWRQKHPIDLLTIGVNHGDRYGIPDESYYVNRLITGALPDGSGIGIFEPDLGTGTEIQFMLRDINNMIASARENSNELMAQIIGENRTARFGLYIDCAGRTAAQSNTPAEEAMEVQKVLNRYNVPLLGFYSGVEIAPLLKKSRGLDWTGVLIIFTE